MTIEEIYAQYHIMPNLQLHQQRVAAVCEFIAKKRGADAEVVTKAGLLHDMGNILKADFGQFPPSFYGEHDLSYWESIKDEFARRYGHNEHDATHAIALEVGASPEMIALIDCMGFVRAREILAHGSEELKILEYADQRVAPYGITSMIERLEEGSRRYMERHRDDYGGGPDLYQENLAALTVLEQQLFEDLDVRPEDITESALEPRIHALRSCEIA